MDISKTAKIMLNNFYATLQLQIHMYTYICISRCTYTKCSIIYESKECSKENWWKKIQVTKWLVCIAAFSEQCFWCFLDLCRRLTLQYIQKSWIQQFCVTFLHSLLTRITQITILHLIIKECFMEYCSCLWQLESTFLMSLVLL